MIRYLSLLFLIFVTGCAAGPSHYIVKEGGAVVMYLDAPGAAEVLFASSIDNFSMHGAMQESRGVWVVKNVKSQEFQYFYVVDGTVVVPECRYKEVDDFGTQNCIYQP